MLNLFSCSYANVIFCEAPDPVYNKRLVGAEIKVLNSTDGLTNGIQCGEPVSEDDVTRSPLVEFFCDPPVKGRYVKLRLATQNFITICEVKVYSDDFETELNCDDLFPIGIWPMNVIYQLRDVSGNGYDGNASTAPQFTTGFTGKKGEAIVVNPNLRTRLAIPLPDQVAGSTFTMAFYVFPFNGSSGVIYEFGQFQIIHASTSEFVSISQIAVIYNDKEVIQCNVVRHEEWTFFAVTFYGFERKIQLWRNGEIACMANTTFSNITFESPMVFGSESVHFKIAKLQVYDRALDEAEMEVAKDRHIGTLSI
ncbi:uncharacterized protein LOC117105850 [Anneissia japonica]|uniref:uncharacterized protein LOC117105850 n=1 Tax=Anneissia japonica TaxID=1529436 RepID=UPI0014256611|nr:uncharacterized protein LOC117105850 [Anneissia japonica]